MKQYTKDSIRDVLTKHPEGIMLGKLQSLVGCSEMTLRHLLDTMVESGEVVKTNIGQSTKKPVNLYRLNGDMENEHKTQLHNK